ncbi:MAG: 4-hydroxythreonine-4-phosphate dehydrogenase PdxA [Pseudogulbenkiania sp.]|nr:4-hydroxythreonine-4-phosphate dehydrogenase PdxA [Pseudogulbenkiania sp.]
MQTQHRPTIALTLGDPAGIGPELIAKLLSQHANEGDAHIVLVGDRWLWKQGQSIAGVAIALPEVDSFAAAREHRSPCFLPVNSVQPEDVQLATVSAAGGASVLDVLTMCLNAAQRGEVDAICFAPLNKQAMKLAGLPFEDELHFFADHLKVDGYFCEFNTLGNVWTSRISSHVPFKDITHYVTKERIEAATSLMYRSLQIAGIAEPRVAVAALNPHGGDGGVCGREEIDVIAPAVAALNEAGFPVAGPFPADTIFLKVRDGQYDAVVTMYHDQGQIAIKLMGFEKGVTVQGGLPIPITTPAHGTAFDIAGQGRANVEATHQAFLIACRMGRAARAARLA